MRILTIATSVFLTLALFSCQKNQVQKEPMKAYSIDFNWGPGGPNSFPAPGKWAEASPEEHVAWYKSMGCNAIQTFAVSCNGYAWYKNGVVPEQPGLKHDFLPEMVRLGHEEGMRVFAYFCASANTKWGLDHPDMSYGTPSWFHIPLTTKYLDYLCASIEDAVLKTGIDGYMLDWLWNPTDEVRTAATGGDWLECEKEAYAELMNEPFPGIDSITAEQKLNYSRKAINRAWKRVHETTKRANPECLIFLTICDMNDPSIEGSDMLREADVVMNEAGGLEEIERVKDVVKKDAELVVCLAAWNGKSAEEVIPAASAKGIGLYGFTAPSSDGNLPPSPQYLLSNPLSSFKGDYHHMASLARLFNGLPME